jgi:hypothetical protein
VFFFFFQIKEKCIADGIIVWFLETVFRIALNIEVDVMTIINFIMR